MSAKQRWMCVLVLPVLLAAAFVAGCSEKEKTHELVGKDISNMFVQRFDGSQIPLFVLKDDRPFVLNVWASTCEACREELPRLLALQQKGQVQVLAVATDRFVGQLLAFIQENKLQQLNILRDPGGVNSRSDLAALELPMTVIADKDMIVRDVKAGLQDWSTPEMQQKLLLMTQEEK